MVFCTYSGGSSHLHFRCGFEIIHRIVVAVIVVLLLLHLVFVVVILVISLPPPVFRTHERVANLGPRIHNGLCCCRVNVCRKRVSKMYVIIIKY